MGSTWKVERRKKICKKHKFAKVLIKVGLHGFDYYVSDAALYPAMLTLIASHNAVTIGSDWLVRLESEGPDYSYIPYIKIAADLATSEPSDPPSLD